MYIRPNTNAKSSGTKQKNDLFRKFKDYFIGATEKEFKQFDSYGRKGYISVNSEIEEKIKDTLGHSIDEIVPITGATGIGKTYLLLYCLKSFYNVDEISTNHPELYEKDGSYDIVYYSDFNITEPRILVNPSRLILVKIQAMFDRLLSHFDVQEPNVDSFIESHELETKYFANDNDSYQRKMCQLATLLNMNEVKVKNVVFVFDDLESLTEEAQSSIMKNYLTLYEYLKFKSNGKYRCKFIFCLRNNTYYNIYKQDFYNTHRASKASCLMVAPSLSDIFRKRFEIILDSNQVKKANNENTWKTARDILVRICDRVDNSYSDLLVKLNNNNIGNALEDFLNIVSNRRWTQKNVNPAASFQIEESEYYINDKNILRILSMGEQDVFFQTRSSSIRCILPNPGANARNDLIAFLVLQAFCQNSYSSAKGGALTSSELLSAEDIIETITNCLYRRRDSSYESRKEQIESIVKNIFTYYEENRFIRENVDPEHYSEKRKFFMLPRGESIFHLFFSQSILFTIFRDAYLWNDHRFDTRCSKDMSFRDLLIETINYEDHLLTVESEFFQKVSQNAMWRDYISFFGAWSVSESFLNGIKKSVQQYYKNKRAPIPNDTLQKIEEYKIKVNSLISVFDEESDADPLF